MTIIEFLKSKSSHESPIGDLARDVINDNDFPVDRDEEGMISYLEYQMRRHNNSGVFNQMMIEYEDIKGNKSDPMDPEVNYNLLRAEQWSFLKINFSSDRAVIVGDPGEIYRVFAIDSIRLEALQFDIYTTRKLNDLLIIPVNRINMGNLSKEVSIEEAIDAIAAIKFNDKFQATEPNFSEMISYLKSQV